MASTAVRYYDSSMRGLGGIDGTPGAFLTIADKVLMNGYGEVTAINIVVLDGKATANFNPGEGFKENATVRISGADIPVLNGDHFVESVGADSVSWSTTAANGTTTTPVTVMGAPLGYSVVVTGTNKRGYKSNAPDGTGHAIYIDDTTAAYLTIRCYESMSAPGVGLNPNPPEGTLSEWPKSYQANTTKRDWFIVGDNKGFHYGVACFGLYHPLSINSPDNTFAIYWVGEGVEETPLKTNFFLLTSEWTTSHPGRAASSTSGSVFINTSSHTVSRDFADVVISPFVSTMLESTSSSEYSTLHNPTYNPPWPNPGNGRTFLSKMRVLEHSSKCRRGTVPGIYGLAHSSKGGLSTGSLFKGVLGLEDRVLIGIGTGSNINRTPELIHVFDIKGPWREDENT